VSASEGAMVNDLHRGLLQTKDARFASMFFRALENSSRAMAYEQKKGIAI
jgi:hypothetical protein